MFKVKKKKIAISFVLLLSSIQAMGQDINPNSCISNNPKLGDSAYWANNSIKLFEQKNLLSSYIICAIF